MCNNSHYQVPPEDAIYSASAAGFSSPSGFLPSAASLAFFARRPASFAFVRSWRSVRYAERSLSSSVSSTKTGAAGALEMGNSVDPVARPLAPLSASTAAADVFESATPPAPLFLGAFALRGRTMSLPRYSCAEDGRARRQIGVHAGDTPRDDGIRRQEHQLDCQHALLPHTMVRSAPSRKQVHPRHATELASLPRDASAPHLQPRHVRLQGLDRLVCPAVVN